MTTCLVLKYAKAKDIHVLTFAEVAQAKRGVVMVSVSSSVSLTPKNMISSVSLLLHIASLSVWWQFLQKSILAGALHKTQNSFLKTTPRSVQNVDVKPLSQASTTAEPFPYPYVVLISSENSGLEHKSSSIVMTNYDFT